MTSRGTLILVAAAACTGLAIDTLRRPDPEPATDPTPAEARPSARASGVGRRSQDAAVDPRNRDGIDDRIDDRRAASERTDEPSAAEHTDQPPPPRPEDRERDAPSEPPAPVVGPPVSPTIEATLAKATKDARDAVASARGEMRRACWDTIDRGGVGDDGVELTVSLGFDAEGHVLASSVQQQSRESYIPGLEACLAPFAHALEVPSPGEPVGVDVTLSLP